MPAPRHVPDASDTDARTAALAARDAAEDARDRAEIARDTAEGAGAAAEAEVTDLRESVAYYQEQARGTREHAAHVAQLVDTELSDLRLERAALLEELTLVDAELQDRAQVNATRGRAAQDASVE